MRKKHLLVRYGGRRSHRAGETTGKIVYPAAVKQL
jgi:hypothetical protein